MWKVVGSKDKKIILNYDHKTYGISVGELEKMLLQRERKNKLRKIFKK